MQPVTHVVMLHMGHVKNVASYTRSLLHTQPVTHAACYTRGHVTHVACYTCSPITHVALLHMQPCYTCSLLHM